MKTVVFLALLGLAAARPQIFYPSGAPVVAYTNAGDEDAKVITSPLTYTYPTTYGTFPYTYPSFPYTYPFPYSVVPNPAVNQREGKAFAGSESSSGSGSAGSSPRSKRSADAEPEPKADPHTVYTGIPFTGTTTYQYPTYPVVSTYGAFPKFPLTYSAFPSFPFTYGYPTVGLPYTNVVKTV